MNGWFGIVTFDDAMDVMVDEATEDITKMAAMSPSEKLILILLLLHMPNIGSPGFDPDVFLYHHRNHHYQI